MAAWLRYEFQFSQINLASMTWTIIVALTTIWLIGAGTRIYLGRHPIGNVDEALGLARIMALAGAAVFGFLVLGFAPSIPPTVPLVAVLFAPAMSVAARLAVRGYRERKARPALASAQRVIVYGAGTRAQALIRSMRSGKKGHYVPVALLDDDPALRHARISGISVCGIGLDLTTVAGRTGGQLLIVAIAGPSPATMRNVVAAAKESGLEVKVLPPLSELLSPWVRFSDLRDLDVTDLPGRNPINTDVASIAGYLTGKRVLVTGAGGSIERNFAAGSTTSVPRSMLDRDESALHAVQLSIYGTAQLGSPNVALADIRDTRDDSCRLRTSSPHVIFHAAALKHLPMLEKYPEQAWKTNVVCTMDILDAAREVNVERFINIYTDKTANPSSVLARSKRIGEHLVADAATKATGTFLSVRFGNVPGSRGSVLTTFSEQLSAGLPLTITHPDVTRFFMTIPEAV
jgi:FlaA1/EpsC-like NDP-sugar epimerase